MSELNNLIATMVTGKITDENEHQGLEPWTH